MTCFKKQRAHELTVTNKVARLTRSCQLLNRFPALLVNLSYSQTKKYLLLLLQAIVKMITFMQHRTR